MEHHSDVSPANAGGQVCSQGNSTERLLSRGNNAPSAFICVAIAVVVFIVSLSKIIDYDIWFHIKSGEYYWTNLGLPDKDPFSCQPPDGVRDVSEWLSELLMFFVWNLGGSVALQLANASILIVTFLLLYRVIRLRGCGQWLALIVTLIAIFVASPRWLPRPYQVVNLGIVFLFWIVERWKRDGRPLPPAWVFVPLFMLWSNLHPGAYSGVALLFLYWTESRFSSKRMPFTAPLAAAIGSLFNADLLGQAQKILTCLTRGDALQNVMEHMPPDMQRVLGWYGIFLLLAASCLPRMIWKRRWLDTALVIGIAFYSLRSRRYIDLLALISAAPITECLHEYLGLISWKFTTTVSNAAKNFVIGAILVGGVFSLQSDKSHQFGFGIDWNMLPTRAVSHAQDLGLSGNCFSVYGWGGFLSYEGYPKWKVFIDGRCLMYGSEHMNRYFDILHARGWEKTFDEYDIRFAFLNSEECGGGEGPIKQPNIADALFDSPDWALVYWDDNSRLFVRKGRGYDALIRENELYFINPNRPMESVNQTGERALQNAESELRRVLSDNPENVTALNLLGSVYLRRGEPVKAEDFFRRAAAFPNATGEVYANLGLSLLLQNQFEESLTNLERAVKLGLGDSALYRQIAEIYRHLGNKKAAEKWQDKAEKAQERH